MKKACLLTIFCLLISSLALAQKKPGRSNADVVRAAVTTCGDDPVISSDGTPVGEDFIASATTAYYKLNVKAGHSYAIEVWAPFDPTDGSSPALSLVANDCSTPVSTTDVTADDPDLSGGFSARISWIQGSDASVHVSFNNPDQNSPGYTYYVRVTDTTLFNARWSTYSGWVSYWGFTNTTATAMTGHLTVRGLDGSIVAQSDVSLPVNQATYLQSNKPPLNVPAQNAGNASFAYIGPPGAVVTDSYMVGTNGLFIPTVFATKHSYR